MSFKISMFPENVSSANTSSSASRRNSSNSALKCDNMTKYPDKKQIEDKLHQIREYLKITNSLMTNMKNTDEQVCIIFSSIFGTVSTKTVFSRH